MGGGGVSYRERPTIASDNKEGPAVSAQWVLTEDEALELLAFLLTAARTQIDEAAEYGPMRLVMAADRLKEAIGARVTPSTRTFLAGALGQVALLATPAATPQYAEQLDAVCAALAAHLLARADAEQR
jgi:hypothetical protein